MESAGAGWREQLGLHPGRFVLLQIWREEESLEHQAVGPEDFHCPFLSSEVRVQL